MKLAEFIAKHHPKIIAEWVRFARGLSPGASSMNEEDLRDHADRLLDAIVDDMASPQTAREQGEKSKGRGEERGMESVGKKHALQRIQSGFQLDQLVAEYRALRASVLRLWSKSAAQHDEGELMRFNEAIDEALTEATNRYMEMVGRTREQFLAMLGHDLRNPLGAILMSAKLMSQSDGLDARNLRAAARIVGSAERMSRMVSELLDLTRTRLGAGIPIKRGSTDLEAVCRQVLAELEAFHPDSELKFVARGDLRGEWDSDRLSQVVSNLVANAVQYGSVGTPVSVLAQDRGEEIVLEVQNVGSPIPPNAIATIFEPMVRVPSGNDHLSTSMGLGLYIAREVVIAHGGTVGVTSTERTGTTFTVRLPRNITSAKPTSSMSEHDESAQSPPVVERSASTQ